MHASDESFVARGGWVLALLVAVAGSGCTSTAVTCPEGQTPCGGTCFDLASDALHCGACNVSCDIGATCVGGTCSCPASLPDVCGIQCVNKQTDAANCGTCGHSCGLGTCAAGACECDTSPSTVALCPASPTTGTCVDTAVSASNCGACGNVCIAGEVCTQSACVCNLPREICAEGSTTVCTDVASDPKHCGSCTNACAAGQICSSGACQQTCAAGFTLCGTTCVDLQTDPAHCGSCTRACATGQSCSAGTCQAACTTLTCGGTCCLAPLVGNACCGTACPYQHRNFVGTPSVQTYYTCTPSFTYDVFTAQKAASVWSPSGNLITPTQSCPAAGGSLCLIWQKPLVGAEIGCGVWCYSGPFEGASAVTDTYSCPCPTLQQVDWY